MKRWLLLCGLAACSNPKATHVKCPAGTTTKLVQSGPNNTELCERPDGTLHGPALTYQGDQKVGERAYINGVLEGVVRSWSNGTLTELGFRDSLANGPYVVTDKSGLLVSGECKAGKRTGAWTSKATGPAVYADDKLVSGTDIPGTNCSPRF